MKKRMFLALALSMLVVIVFSHFNRPEKPPAKKKVSTQSKNNSDTSSENFEAQKTKVTSSTDKKTGKSAEKFNSPSELADDAGTVPFSTEYIRGYFSRRGAELASVKLQKYNLVEDRQTKFNLVNDTGGGLRLESSFPGLSLSGVKYKQLNSKDENTYIFQHKLNDNLIIQKIYRLQPEKQYRLRLTVKLKNTGNKALSLDGLDFPTGRQGQGSLALRWGPGFGRARKKKSRFDKVYLYYGKDGEMQYYSTEDGGGFWALFGAGDNNKTYKFSRGPVDWLGVSNRYFIAAVVPRTPFHILYLDKRKENKSGFTAWGGFAPLNLSARETKSYEFELYLGPKKYYKLQNIKNGLESTLNYGWFTILSLPLLKGLNYIYAAIPNYGIAIILLSIGIKIILYPLTKKGLSNMQQMKELQPKIQELQDKYEDDKEKLNQKMMELYQEENLNPLGGCLPMLLQLPIFISLYRTLQYSIELRGAPFCLWITDLSAKDPYYILPVLMGILMFAQQWYTTASSGGEVMGQQKTMVYVMPVVFVFIFMRFPAGLVLYWMTNSGATLIQYWLINKSLES